MLKSVLSEAQSENISDGIRGLFEQTHWWLYAAICEQVFSPELAAMFDERLAERGRKRIEVGECLRRRASALVATIEASGLDATPVRELAARCDHYGGVDGFHAWWPPLRAKLETLAAQSQRRERRSSVSLLNPRHRVVLNFLTKHVGQGGDRPTMDLIAEKCRLGKKTVCEAMHELRRLGLIESSSGGTMVVRDLA